MNEEQQLIAALQKKLPGSAVRCKLTSGMWIVEVVRADIAIATKQAVMDVVNQTIGQIFPNPQVIWKIFLYQNYRERYISEGTLHTIPQTYSPEGISTTTLAAMDCYLNVTSFDAEVMQLGFEDGIVILGREMLGDDGQPVLPYQAGVDYLWLESLGGNYGLVQNGTRRVANGDIEIILGVR